jgi:hypothetical protein
MMLPASRHVENAWMTLEQRGAPPAELLSADIYDSWMRCISFGLDTLRPPSPEFVSPAILRQEQRRCSLVRGLALAEMHTLHQQIAGSNFLIAFANADGLLLDIISDLQRRFERSEHSARNCLDGKYLRYQRSWHRGASQTSDRRAWARALFFALQQSHLRRSANLRARWRTDRNIGCFVGLYVPAGSYPGTRRHGSNPDREWTVPRTSSRKCLDRVPQSRRIFAHVERRPAGRR